MRIAVFSLWQLVVCAAVYCAVLPMPGGHFNSNHAARKDIVFISSHYQLFRRTVTAAGTLILFLSPL
jgi:hypothetical protein